MCHFVLPGFLKTSNSSCLEINFFLKDNERIDIHRNLEKVYQQFKECEENSVRYTDKRIDKLIDTYGIKKEKDLLKG